MLGELYDCSAIAELFAQIVAQYYKDYIIKVIMIDELGVEKQIYKNK
ncbi:hypothetical protein I6U48_26595 [Clostridium sp. PL3]|uniref:Uncharacterized protein n=1 Tax=Clostridium thailandense TaxID=2794346 RepID=A0A949X4G5_9CLOT|nr:hypothetical protein [Clostridium thailandense]MBV7276454.1 hypothetical protein [Clostridium thailandense]